MPHANQPVETLAPLLPTGSYAKNVPAHHHYIAQSNELRLSPQRLANVHRYTGPGD